MNDAAILYRTHVQAIRSLPEDQRLAAYDALIDYCMDDAEDAEGVALAMLMMAKPVLDKWKTKRKAGQHGGEAERKQTESKREANVKQNESKPQPKEKVKVKDIKEKDILTDISKESPAKAEPLMVAARQIVDHLNQKIGTHYMASSKETVKMIKARMDAGHSVDDFFKVIDTKAAEWLGTEQEQYLRPETLFCAKHFESYLNQKPVKPPNRKPSAGKFANFPQRDDEEHMDLVRQVLAAQ